METDAITNTSPRIAAYNAALAESARRRRSGDVPGAFVTLERAHVLGQRDFGRHLAVHVAMLRLAWAMGDKREVRGQILRLFLTLPGHLTRRLPTGNTGASNVSAFETMPVSDELQRLLDDREERRGS